MWQTLHKNKKTTKKKAVKAQFLPRFPALIVDPLERLLEKRSSHKTSVVVVREASSLWYSLPKIFFNGKVREEKASCMDVMCTQE